MKIGSLFSGIGGFELGLEWAGLGQVIWQCEIDSFCRKVLHKHWPEAKRYKDIVNLVPPNVDVLCGGFPCQDVSSAGNRVGLSGERSGLWYEYKRIIDCVKPQIVVVENVASGERRWLPHVRRDLHLLGYSTNAYLLSAKDVGAPHLRKRIFVVAYSNSKYVQFESGRQQWESRKNTLQSSGDGSQESLADSNSEWQLQQERCEQSKWKWVSNSSKISNTSGSRLERSWNSRTGSATCCWWAIEPSVGRVDNGLHSRLDGRKRAARIKALGNAIVPQCAEVVGKIIQNDLLSQYEHSNYSRTLLGELICESCGYIKL